MIDFALTKRLIKEAINAVKPGFYPPEKEEYCREEDIVKKVSIKYVNNKKSETKKSN
ncbi:hypothetical protein [Neobacillus niacini]|uniref:hypothetical protein n=1 Tax=Neobacillus niacini TaxID=86668 RepID=UPI00286BD4E8|nr:hypothetical protein [Neobacillus niacini]